MRKLSDREAPIPAIRGTEIERQGSTQSGSSTQSRLAPEPVIARCSFDHLVGKVEDTRRDRQAERLGGLEVDD